MYVNQSFHDHRNSLLEIFLFVYLFFLLNSSIVVWIIYCYELIIHEIDGVLWTIQMAFGVEIQWAHKFEQSKPNYLVIWIPS